MGVASLVFDPHPPNFTNLHNFSRCTNDITMTFLHLQYHQIYKKPLGVSIPGAPVFVAPSHYCEYYLKNNERLANNGALSVNSLKLG